MKKIIIIGIKEPKMCPGALYSHKFMLQIDIAEILLELALNTNQSINHDLFANSVLVNFQYFICPNNYKLVNPGEFGTNI